MGTGAGTGGGTRPLRRRRGRTFWRIIAASLVILVVIFVLIWLLTGQRGCNAKLVPSATTSQVYSVMVPTESVDNYRILGIITKQNGNEVVNLAAFERFIKGSQPTSTDFIKSLVAALYEAQNGGPETDSLRDAFNYLVWQGLSSDPELKKLLANATPAKTMGVTRSATKHKKTVVARKPKTTSVAKKTLVESKPSPISSVIAEKSVPDKISPKYGEIQIFKQDSNSKVTTTYRVIPPKKIRIRTVTKVTPIIPQDVNGGDEQ